MRPWSAGRRQRCGPVDVLADRTGPRRGLSSNSKHTSAVGGATSISILTPWLGLGFESGFESGIENPPSPPHPRPSRSLRRKLTLTFTLALIPVDAGPLVPAPP